FVLVENRRSIARPDIVALLINRGRVVDAEKIIQNLLETGFSFIECDFDAFGVAGVVIVSSVFVFAIVVSYFGYLNSLLLSKYIIHYPETSTCYIYFFSVSHMLII